VSGLCAVARERIIELKLDDFDKRFPPGNIERLWA